MTREQILKVDKVRAHLNDCRRELDDVMYYMTGVTDEEHHRLREIYDTICAALDLM